jgi:hypothetical protein
MTNTNNPFVEKVMDDNTHSEDIETPYNEENNNTELNSFLRPTFSDERLDLDEIICLPGIIF